MFVCRGCGSAGQGRVTRVYCSLTCQRTHERRLNVARWLETGVAHAGTRHGHYVRQYIWEEQSGRCSICALPAEWNGRELSFVLDHINGDSSNNWRSNLRLVCPHCDSQLPTYKSRNKGRGRYLRRQRYSADKSY